MEDGRRGAEGSVGGAGRDIRPLLSGAEGQAEESVLMGKGKLKRNLVEDPECGEREEVELAALRLEQRPKRGVAQIWGDGLRSGQ